MLSQKIVYSRMGQEVESTNRVKFQPVPVGTKHQTSSDPADSGKKVFPGSEAVPLPTFSGFAD